MANLYEISLGNKYPEIVNCVVEISARSNQKYEYDPDIEAFRLDRCLISSMTYPMNYGFIPQTLADDGDALDVLIYGSEPLITGCVVPCKIVGALDMIDQGKKDYKLLVIPTFNPHFIDSVDHVQPPVLLDLVKDFFESYKKLENKKVEVLEWLDKESSISILEEAHEMWRMSNLVI